MKYDGVLGLVYLNEGSYLPGPGTFCLKSYLTLASNGIAPPII
jgi:hypothetical protein